MQLCNHVNLQQVKRFKRNEGYAIYCMYILNLECRQVREDKISLREWSGGAAPMRTSKGTLHQSSSTCTNWVVIVSKLTLQGARRLSIDVMPNPRPSWRFLLRMCVQYQDNLSPYFDHLKSDIFDAVVLSGNLSRLYCVLLAFHAPNNASIRNWFLLFWFRFLLYHRHSSPAPVEILCPHPPHTRKS